MDTTSSGAGGRGAGRVGDVVVGDVAVGDAGSVDGGVGQEEEVRARAAVGELSSVVGVLGDVDARALGSGVLAELLVELDRIESRLGAVRLGVLAAFGACRGFRASGHRSVAAWLQDVLDKSPTSARRQARTAQRLYGGLESTRRALAEGEIDVERASAVAEGVAKATGEDAARRGDGDDGDGDDGDGDGGRGVVEDRLLSTARGGDARRVRKAARRFEQAADAEAARRGARRAFEQRTFSVRQDTNGVAWVQGRLHQWGGEVVQTALDALSAPSGRDDERSHSQRMADALVELAEIGLNGGRLPDRAGGRPRVRVLVPLETIESRSGAAAGTLSWSGPCPPPALEQAVCDADLDWLITDTAGTPLHLGRSRRLASQAQRAALEVRDGGCRWPGCHARAEWCIAHHVDFWDDGGPTDLDNLVLVCGAHHNFVHHGQWRLALDEQASVTVTSPAGSITRTETAAQARDRHQHATTSGALHPAATADTAGAAGAVGTDGVDGVDGADSAAGTDDATRATRQLDLSAAGDLDLTATTSTCRLPHTIKIRLDQLRCERLGGDRFGASRFPASRFGVSQFGADRCGRDRLGSDGLDPLRGARADAWLDGSHGNVAHDGPRSARERPGDYVVDRERSVALRRRRAPPVSPPGSLRGSPPRGRPPTAVRTAHPGPDWSDASVGTRRGWQDARHA